MHAEAIQVLKDIETNCDTNALTYGGVNYWPLCRLRLWSALMQRNVLAKKEGAEKVANDGRTWPTIDHLQVEMAGPPPSGLLRTQDLPDGTLAPRALFYLRAEEYSDKVNSRAFAKTSDSAFERARARWPAAKLELAEARFLTFERHHPSLYLNLDTAARGLTLDPPAKLENVTAVAAAVQKADPLLSLNGSALTEDMGKIFFLARVFEKTLRTLQPKTLFLSVYYHPVGMAWTLACRRLGVRSVDMQHGRLGPHHGLYTQLTAAPREGYDLIPDAIWCWGAPTKHDIEVDRNSACTRHGGVIGGNAWLHKWRYGDRTSLEGPEVAAFEQRTAGKKRILVSLQPLESPVGPELLAAMKESPPDWLWLLRLHPLRRHTVPEVAAILARAGITNAELDQATALPLFSLLRLARHHVTVFSSVVVEAASFNLRSSLLGDEGRAAFASHIARGICRYTPAADAILAHVNEALTAQGQPLDDDFIDMSEGVVDRAIESFLA